MKPIALIVYEDGNDALASYADTLRKAFDSAGYAVRVGMASKVGVSDVLASNVLALGAATGNSKPYEELKRLFSGINLAGRTALLFSDGTKNAVSSLKNMLADSEINVHPEHLKAGADPAVWTDSVASRSEPRRTR